MAATHFSGPVKIQGAIISGPSPVAGELSAQGDAVLMQDYTFTAASMTSGVGVDAIRVPKGVSLVDVEVLVVAASDAVTSSTIKVTDGTDDIVTGFNGKSAGNSYLTASDGDGTITDMGRFLDPAPSSAVDLQVVYTIVGAETTGEFVVRVKYRQAV